MWFIHAECDVDTYECNYDTQESYNDTHTCQNHTLRVEITLVCDVHTHTVMNTRTSVIYLRRVWSPHAECDFYTQSNFHSQSAISTRRVWLPNAVWFWHAQMWFQPAQERLTHAECDVDTYECDHDTHESDYDTYTCKNRTLRTSVISERKVW
jgi:hypothetical protein